MSTHDWPGGSSWYDPLPIGEHDAAHVGRVMRVGDWWSADLLRLIAKSDIQHRERIRLAFPSHVAAYEKWYADGDPDD